MKEIFTSSYALNGNSPDAIGISYGIPKNYEGKTLSKLAPSGEMLRKLHDKIINYTQIDYKEAYLNLLEERGVDAQELVDELPDGAVLLCYEDSGEFCHRRILAEWIEEKTGLVVPEATEEHTEEKNKQNKLVDSLIDF